MDSSWRDDIDAISKTYFKHDTVMAQRRGNFLLSTLAKMDGDSQKDECLDKYIDSRITALTEILQASKSLNRYTFEIKLVDLATYVQKYV